MVSKKKIKAKSKVKTKTASKPKSKPKLKTKAKPVAKIQVKAKLKAKVQVKAKLKAKVAVKAKAQPQTKAPAKAPSKLSPPKNVDYSKAITPLGSRLVVRVAESERVTAGGLIIPDSVSQATGFLRAKVLAVGRGTQNKRGSIKPMDVKVGDTVLFSQHSGLKVKFNSEDLQIILETDVMGVVQN